MDIPRWCAIGIDPGTKGGLAALYADGTYETVKLDTSEPIDVSDKLPRRGSALRYAVAIEKVGAFPGQGRSSIFSFGRSYGIPIGVVVERDYALSLVPPQEWQKLVPVDIPRGAKLKKERKEALITASMDKWITDGPRSSGEADALWLAFWVARTRFYAEDVSSVVSFWRER